MSTRPTPPGTIAVAALLQFVAVACGGDDSSGGTPGDVGAGGTTAAQTSGTGARGSDVAAGGVTTRQTSTTPAQGASTPSTNSVASAGGAAATGGTSAHGSTISSGGTSAKGNTGASGGASAKASSSASGGTSAKASSSASGGTSAKASSSASGGTSAIGGSTGGTTINSNSAGPTKTCGCLTSSGNYSGNPLTATIVVDDGETYDGECKTFLTKSKSSGGLGDGSQEESQSPLFRVNAGATLKNVILGAPAADGIHFYGNATAQNIHWLDIGEDAATIKSAATVNLDCGSAKNGSDKVFQVNAKATWNISNFTISSAGKTMRENGDQCYPVTAVFDHCDISDMDEVIFRTDCTSSKVTISNTRYSGIKDGLVLIGSSVYNSSTTNVTITNVVKY